MDIVLSKGIRTAATAAVLCSWFAMASTAVAESNSVAVRSAAATMHDWVDAGDNGIGWRTYLLSLPRSITVAPADSIDPRLSRCATRSSCGSTL